MNSIAYGSSKQYQSVRPSDTLNVDATLLPRQPRVQVRLRLSPGHDEQLEPPPGQRHRGPQRDRARHDRPHPARAGLELQGQLHLALPAGHVHLGPPDAHGRRALGPPEGRERRLHGQRQPALPGDPARPRLRRRGHQDLVERHLAARGLHLRARRRAQDAAAGQLLDLHPAARPPRRDRRQPDRRRRAGGLPLERLATTTTWSTTGARSTSRAGRSARRSTRSCPP